MLCQPAHRGLAITQTFDHVPAGRVGERAEYLVECYPAEHSGDCKTGTRAVNTHFADSSADTELSVGRDSKAAALAGPPSRSPGRIRQLTAHAQGPVNKEPPQLLAAIHPRESPLRETRHRACTMRQQAIEGIDRECHAGE